MKFIDKKTATAIQGEVHEAYAHGYENTYIIEKWVNEGYDRTEVEETVERLEKEIADPPCN